MKTIEKKGKLDKYISAIDQPASENFISCYSSSNEDEIKVESEGPESLRIDEIGILDEILFAKVNYKTQLSVTHKKETLLDSGEKHDFKYRIQSGDRKQFIMDHILGKEYLFLRKISVENI